MAHRELWRYTPRRMEQLSPIKCAVLMSTLLVLGFCGVIMLRCFTAKGTNEKLKGHSPQQPTYEYDRLSKEQCQEICTTKDCINTASLIIGRMDASTDPCEDFYRFSCGKYDTVPMDKTKRVQFMSETEDEITHVVRGIIESIPKNLPQNTPGHSASKARNMYDSCISFHSTEENAIPTALKYLEYFGVKDWPNINPHYEFINPDLDVVIARLTGFATNPVFQLSIENKGNAATEMNSTKGRDSNIPLKIKVAAAKRPLFLTHILGKDRLINNMMDILDYFGVAKETHAAIIDDAFAFSNALTGLKEVSFRRMMTCTLNSSISCSAYTFDCANEKNTEMERWCKVVSKAVDDMGIRRKYSEYSITIEDRFYFEDVRSLLNGTSQRTIAYGLALQFFVENSMLMNYRFRTTTLMPLYPSELMDKLIGDRFFMCTLWVSIHLPALVGSVFHGSKYQGQLQNEGDEIFEDIQEFITALPKNMTWMDLTAQESLQKMMESVPVSLHFDLKHISNPSQLDEFYETLNMRDDSFLHNAMELRKFSVSLKYLYHDDASTKLSREKNLFVLHPHYDFDNIFLDFASFIHPLISKDRPRYSNLGLFGFLLAHEYSHGVEIFLRNPKNMSSNFENVLREKKECLVEQYSQYEIDHILKNVNGSATLNENMADFFAIRATYQALEKYQKNHAIEKALPGLKYSVHQLFFISVAQFLCESELNSMETWRAYIDDRHSPNKIRILGVMKNFPPFSEAFNCRLGSALHPRKKCDF